MAARLPISSRVTATQAVRSRVRTIQGRSGIEGLAGDRLWGQLLEIKGQTRCEWG